ncbi:MAG: metallophosphoesterase family protein [Candidatus Izemoplasmatales bacterium]
MRKIEINERNDFKILQLTDLHLMNLPADNITFDLIQKLVKKTDPDLIIITGDMTMCQHQDILDRYLQVLMDKMNKPWTFVFGNHDEEGPLTKEELAAILSVGPQCMYENTPGLSGVGNHLIVIEKNGTPIYKLFMLDSLRDRIDTVSDQKIWSYDFIKDDQIDWVMNQTNQVHSLLFFHIPLPEFKEAKLFPSFKGEFNEGVCSSNYQTNLFEKAVESGVIQGIFVGHDHVNDFSFEKEGILLAYGRCTGHYDYTLPSFIKGGRLITINTLGEMNTEVILETEI